MAQRFMTVFIKNFTKNNPLSLPTSTVSCLNSVIFHTLLTGRRSFLDGTQCNIFCIIDAAAVDACIKICWGDKKTGRKQEDGFIGAADGLQNTSGGIPALGCLFLLQYTGSSGQMGLKDGVQLVAEGGGHFFQVNLELQQQQQTADTLSATTMALTIHSKQEVHKLLYNSHHAVFLDFLQCALKIMKKYNFYGCCMQFALKMLKIYNSV